VKEIILIRFDGVTYILQQAVKRALPNCPSLAAKQISPHVIRHTTAMHLQSGVDITVIALWLGHESLETTHIYIEADLRMKQKALEKGSNLRAKPFATSHHPTICWLFSRRSDYADYAEQRGVRPLLLRHALLYSA
jgi:hypothetical protein